MERFQYTDRIDEDQIRLLTLHPSEDNNALIRCTLRTTSRDKCSKYEALSYCWGDETVSSIVHVNGLRFEVRNNLASALQHLRLPTNERILWIDAICINQDNDSEKSEQVARMGETYSGCYSLVAWLGTGSETSSLALRAIETRSEQYRGQGVLQVYNSVLPLPATIDGVNLIEYVSAVVDLFKRPWFSRLWVIQEICLGPKAVVVCGHQTIAFSHLANFQLSLLLCPDLQHGILHAAPEEHEIWKSLYTLLEVPLILIRQAFQVSQGELDPGENIISIRENTCRFLKLVWLFRNRKCEKPQDRFYALRNIAHDMYPDDFRPDYTDSLSVTYAKITIALIKSGQNLNVLALCKGAITVAPDVLRRPSWAPEFDTDTVEPEKYGAFGFLTNFIGLSGFFSASGVSIASAFSSTDYLKLTVKGHEIGTITKSSTVLWIDGTIEEAKEIVEAELLTFYNQSSGEVFWRTLITNRAADSSPAEASI